jgi:uncharacterized protein (TIGR02246 family)
MRMNGLWALTTVLLLVVGPGAKAEERIGSEGLTDLVSQFSRAWSRHDPAALADLWSVDGDLMNPLGRMARGRAELMELFKDEHLGYMRGTSLAVKVTGSRTLAPGLTFVDGEALLTGVQTPDGKSMPALKHLIFGVAAAGEGGWRFVSVRLAVPVPPPPEE